MKSGEKFVESEDFDKKIVEALIRSEEDIENGRVVPAGEVFKQLKKEYDY